MNAKLMNYQEQFTIEQRIEYHRKTIQELQRKIEWRSYRIEQLMKEQNSKKELDKRHQTARSRKS
jgi:hypothetical protein